MLGLAGDGVHAADDALVLEERLGEQLRVQGLDGLRQRQAVDVGRGGAEADEEEGDEGELHLRFEELRFRFLRG